MNSPRGCPDGSPRSDPGIESTINEFTPGPRPPSRPSSVDRHPVTALGETHENGPAGHRDVLSPAHWRGVSAASASACRHEGGHLSPTPLHGSVRKAKRWMCQSRLVVNKVVPRTASTSFRSVSVNPTLTSTLREAVFQSQTVAHRRSCPDEGRAAHREPADEGGAAAMSSLLIARPLSTSKRWCGWRTPETSTTSARPWTRPQPRHRPAQPARPPALPHLHPPRPPPGARGRPDRHRPHPEGLAGWQTVTV